MNEGLRRQSVEYRGTACARLAHAAETALDSWGAYVESGEDEAYGAFEQSLGPLRDALVAYREMSS